MREELDKNLCSKYPELFKHRHADPQFTPRAWGFDCGDGWYNILNQLMSQIQHHIDWKNRDTEVVQQVTLDQVKEKFGTLLSSIMWLSTFFKHCIL